MMTEKEKVLTGLKWTASAKLGGQIVTWVITIFVIRLLSPADYGLMAMATVIISLAALITEMGLGSALIQAPHLTDLLVRRIFGAVLCLNALLSAAVFLAAPLVATFFAEPRIVSIVQVAGMQFVLAALVVVPESLLRREMQFRRLALTEMSTSILASIATVLMALWGMGVWSLVFGNLVLVASRAFILQLLSEHHYLPSFHFRGLRTPLLFGGQITANRILWHVLSQADMIIAGKMLGREALGVYSVALHLATLPMQKTMSVVNQVAFPAFSRAHNRSPDLHVGIERGVRILAIAAIPVLWGMAAVAPEIVELALGSKWQESVITLQLIAVVIPFRMVAAFLSTATCGVGRADVDLCNTLVAVVVMTLAFAAGVQWGLLGLAASWVIGVPLTFALNFPRLRRLLELRVRRLLQLTAVPVIAGATMVGAVWIARHGLSDALGTALRLAILVLVGAFAYGGAATVCNRSIWSELRLTMDHSMP